MTMTNEKVSAVCTALAHAVRKTNNDWQLCPRPLYGARSPNGIDGLNVSSMEHAFFMCVETPKLMKAGKRDKAMRWLGYLQGALTAIGVLTLEEAKKMNMPETPRVITVYEATDLALSLRTSPNTVQGVYPEQMPTQATRAAFLRWALMEAGEARTYAARTLAAELEEWACGSHPFTAAVARALAHSLRESCVGRNELASDMPTERLRQAAVRWEDAIEDCEVDSTATSLADKLDEWASRAENGEAVYEASSMARAAVSDDPGHQSAVPAISGRVHVTAAAFVGLGENSVAIDWTSSSPDVCRVNKDTPINIDELRGVLDVLDAHRKAL